MTSTEEGITKSFGMYVDAVMIAGKALMDIAESTTDEMTQAKAMEAYVQVADLAVEALAIIAEAKKENCYGE